MEAVVPALSRVNADPFRCAFFSDPATYLHLVPLRNTGVGFKRDWFLYWLVAPEQGGGPGSDKRLS